MPMPGMRLLHPAQARRTDQRRLFRPQRRVFRFRIRPRHRLRDGLGSGRYQKRARDRRRKTLRRASTGKTAPPACCSATVPAPSWSAPPPTPNVGLLGTKLGAFGEGVDLLCIPNGGSSAPATAASIAAGDHFIKMKGKEVFKLRRPRHGRSRPGYFGTTRTFLRGSDCARDSPSSQPADHRSHSQYLELPMERFFVNVDRYGNTSAASIPIALDEARRTGRIKSGRPHTPRRVWGGLDLRKRADSLVTYFFDASSSPSAACAFSHAS